MRMPLPIVDEKIGAYFGGPEGAKIGYATCYTGGNVVDPLNVKSPRIKKMEDNKYAYWDRVGYVSTRLFSVILRRMAEAKSEKESQALLVGFKKSVNAINTRELAAVYRSACEVLD